MALFCLMTDYRLCIFSSSAEVLMRSWLLTVSAPQNSATENISILSTGPSYSGEYNFKLHFKGELEQQICNQGLKRSDWNGNHFCVSSLAALPECTVCMEKPGISRHSVNALDMVIYVRGMISYWMK